MPWTSRGVDMHYLSAEFNFSMSVAVAVWYRQSEHMRLRMCVCGRTHSLLPARPRYHRYHRQWWAGGIRPVHGLLAMLRSKNIHNRPPQYV